MKKSCLALITAFIALFNVNVWAAEIANEVKTVFPPSPIIGIDSNHDLILDEKSVAAGLDSFLVRPAKPNEVTNKIAGLFKGDDNKFYIPVNVSDLRKMDIDKNHFIDKDELAKHNLLVAQHDIKDTKTIHILTASDKKIAGIHLPPSGGNKIVVIWENSIEEEAKEIAFA